jgi:hypothetical protein
MGAGRDYAAQSRSDIVVELNAMACTRLLKLAKPSDDLKSLTELQDRVKSGSRQWSKVLKRRGRVGQDQRTRCRLDRPLAPSKC